MEDPKNVSSNNNNMKVIETLGGHVDKVWHLSWSASGAALATCGADKTIRIWTRDPNGRWRCSAILEEGHQRTIRKVEWSSDSKHLAASSFDATTSVWEHLDAEFECVATLEGHENEVKGVAWDSTGNLLATCSRDKTVWIWAYEPSAKDNEEEFVCVSVLHGHTQDVKAIRWHPNQQILASCSYDDTIKIWQDDGEDDWQCSETLRGHSSTVWDIAFHPSGKYLASCSDDLTVKIWKCADKWPNIYTISGQHNRCIYSLDWSKDGSLIATGSGDDYIRLFKVDFSTTSNTKDTSTNNTANNTNNNTTNNTSEKSSQQEGSFVLACAQEKAHSSDVNCVRWNPVSHSDGSYLLGSCGDDGNIKLWTFNRV